MSKGSWMYTILSLVLVTSATLLWAGPGWDWSRESPRGVPLPVLIVASYVLAAVCGVKAVRNRSETDGEAGR